jgi:queuine/archaeosine tRNA-ribosyltransferase
LVLLAAFSGVFAQQKPRQGEESSVTVMHRSNMTSVDTGGLGIFLDDQKIGTLTTSTTKLIIPNGEHTIHAETSARKKSNVIRINANSHDYIFTIIQGLLSIKIEKTKEEKLKDYQMDNSAIAPPVQGPPPAAGGIEDAIHKAAAVFIKSLDKDSTVAVINVSAQDKDMAEFIIDEFVFVLVDSGLFKVVGQNNLNAIEDEQQFQLAGDMDDSSAVSIGNMLGANIVITGAVSGAEGTRRLRMKALDVKTAEILAMASERY